ncbi:MAG: hypothetical protein N2Z23_09685 [Pyrinomonadaceae bacterium]|nr:hypothetical protein [Pyrinomonadaceae bacterium]MCX7640693.1 hypothetical protein [Pyrinomonadaceae bacterium]MDW8305397.1 hypothetical protein [Acidobacteriota bacterium]
MEEKRNRWARPGMKVVFKAEVMPGKSREERTFTVDKVLWNDRVILKEIQGEHRRESFEEQRFV